VTKWRDEHAEQVWVENSAGQKKKLWKKKGGVLSYPWKELGTQQSVPIPRPPPFSPTAGAELGALGAAAAGGAPAPSAASAELDLDAPVPAFFKKMQGKTWRQVVSTSEGRKYLQYLLQKSDKHPFVKETQQALGMQATHDFDKDEPEPQQQAAQP